MGGMIVDPRLLTLVPIVCSKLRALPKKQHHWGICSNCGGICLYSCVDKQKGSKGSAIEIHLLEPKSCMACKDEGMILWSNRLTSESIGHFGSWILTQSNQLKLS